MANWYHARGYIARKVGGCGKLVPCQVIYSKEGRGGVANWYHARGYIARKVGVCGKLVPCQVIYSKEDGGVWQTGTMPGDRTIGEGGPAHPDDHPQRVEHLTEMEEWTLPVGGPEDRKGGTVLTDL